MITHYEVDPDPTIEELIAEAREDMELEQLLAGDEMGRTTVIDRFSFFPPRYEQEVSWERPDEALQAMKARDSGVALGVGLSLLAIGIGAAFSSSKKR